MTMGTKQTQSSDKMVWRGTQGSTVFKNLFTEVVFSGNPKCEKEPVKQDAHWRRSICFESQFLPGGVAGRDDTVFTHTQVMSQPELFSCKEEKEQTHTWIWLNKGESFARKLDD